MESSTDEDAHIVMGVWAREQAARAGSGVPINTEPSKRQTRGSASTLTFRRACQLRPIPSTGGVRGEVVRCTGWRRGLGDGRRGQWTTFGGDLGAAGHACATHGAALGADVTKSRSIRVFEEFNYHNQIGK